MLRSLLLSILVLLSSAWAGGAAAVTISFETTNLPDVVPGENLYRYSYALSDFPHPANFGFDITFDRNLYVSLQSPPPGVGPEWDVLTLQPDANLPDDGLYDALALVDDPTTLSGFSVEFVWLGTGAPGAQPFRIYDATFGEVESGNTAPVPEPGTLTLLTLGVSALTLRMRNRRG